MSRFALIAIVFSAGCSLYIEDKHASGGNPPPTGDAGAAVSPDFTQFKNDVYPILDSQCMGCHVGDTAGAELNLFGSVDSAQSVYAALIGNPTLVCQPTSSRLLTKGEHEGPALGADDLSVILEWLSAVTTDGTVTCP